jgi:hypothetical protein
MFRLTNVIPERIIFDSRGITVYTPILHLDLLSGFSPSSFMSNFVLVFFYLMFTLHIQPYILFLALCAVTSHIPLHHHLLRFQTVAT